MWRELLLNRLLLVYQMPKTGSQTVEATVQACGLPVHVLRVHFLSRVSAARVRAGLKSQANTEWERHTREQLQQAQRLRWVLWARRWLLRCGAGIAKVEAICAVRDPLGLGLAAIFENYLHLFDQLESATLEACRKELLRPRDHKFVHQWFDLELKPILGIDVYQRPFPQQQGYGIYESPYGRALVYRFEALNRLPEMLTEFLGVPVRTALNRNLGSAKDYAAAYERAKQTLKLPREFVQAQCHCRMMRHFYSQAERQRFQEHWSEPQNASLSLHQPGQGC